MNKKLKLLLVGTSAVSAFPIVAAACNNNDNKDDSKTTKKINLSEEINKLPVEKQIELVSQLKLDKNAKAQIIGKLNSGVGITGAIVWYMRSAEAKLQSLQAYTLATLAFDNLKKRAEEDKMDYSALNVETGVVSNPKSGYGVPVVFMDVDETVFINEKTESWMVAENNGRFSEDKKDSVDAKGNRRAVAGAINFIKHVYANGGIVMFNSGIRQLKDSVEGIKKNLIKEGVDAKYLHDWMFWCSGVNPYNEDGTFATAPWAKAISDFENKTDNSKVSTKNQRMNAVSDNTAGWDFSKSQTGAGDKVVTKVIMKIGDDASDFYDDAYKKQAKFDITNKFFFDESNKDIKAIFTDVNGAEGIKITVDKKTKMVKKEKLAWHQFNLQVPGNAMYGSWTKGLGYGSFSSLWEELNDIYSKSTDDSAK
ncbi:HAD family acid phosphatase [Mycoplasma zalophidermidis]|uniref:HAD family acid phosphatase n=1 Tax=Mycoplasma zalophidermidis TaxID=398174 RepID=UPI001C119D9D|nr:HAD family acid phosphatase [Mycoplasma zalophidermidis]MBU4689624.1 variable surface lipoprotein [Mycoplasma zalophidermidis]MCR8966518.1 variable surface lipoprotein [Mycoplasma zalophidermidis]